MKKGSDGVALWKVLLKLGLQSGRMIKILTSDIPGTL